jgi:hypothetical protein
MEMIFQTIRLHEIIKQVSNSERKEATNSLNPHSSNAEIREMRIPKKEEA